MKLKVIGAVISGGVIVLFWFAWAIIDSYLLGSCDYKLGCGGGIAFSVFLSTIAGVISASAFFILANFSGLELKNRKQYYIAAIISGLLLALLLFTITSWRVGVIGMIVGWAVLSCLLIGLTIHAIETFLPERT